MGRKRAKRTRLATGVYADQFGISVRVRIKEHRFPLGTPLADLRKFRREALDDLPALPTRRGTLAADVVTYLATLPEDVRTGIERRQRRSDARRLLDRWVSAPTVHEGRAVTFGQLPREAITSVMIRAQLAAWRSEGLSEGYCDHHRRELGTLYTVLNGKEGVNPVRAVPKFRRAYDDPRGFDLAVLDAILDSMPDRGKAVRGEKRSTVNQSKIRLRVMRHCGIPPQTLRKVTPRDLDLAGKTLTIRSRRKGDGAKGRILPLTAGAVEAWRAFARHKLFGWFDQSSVNQAFKRAAKHYRDAWLELHPDAPCPVPDDLHAYDLRHAFGSEVYRKTGNKKVVGYLLGHAEHSGVTDRYVQAAVDGVVREAVSVLDSASTGASTHVGKSRENPNKGGKHGRTDVA